MLKRENVRVYLVVEHEFRSVPDYGRHINTVLGCYSDVAPAKKEAQRIAGSGDLGWHKDVSVVRWSTKTQEAKVLYTFSPDITQHVLRAD